MKRCLALFITIGMVLGATAGDAAAEGKLKRLVFEDCEAAKTQAAQLAPDQQPDFCSYLARVLGMQTGVSGELNGPVPPPTGGAVPIDALPGGGISHIFDPSREQEAKRCAIEILRLSAPVCAQTIPELLPLFEGSLLAGDLAAELESAIWAITLKAKAGADSLDSRWYTALISQLGNDASGYLAANILSELRERAIPHLLSALTSGDPRRRELAQSFLLRLDSDGALVVPALIGLLDSADEDLRIRAAKLLAGFPKAYPQAVPRLIDHLGDPSPTVEDGIYESLGAMVEKESLANVPKNQDQTNALLRGFEGATAARRAVLEEVIPQVAEPSQATFNRLSALAHSTDPDARERALRMLAPFVASQPALLSNLYDALYDPIPAIRLGAVRVLAAEPSRPEEKTSALLKALKSNASEKDTNGKNEFIIAVAKAVRSLPVTPSSARMVPYFLDALATRPGELTGKRGDRLVRSADTDSEPAQALIHIGKEAAPLVTKALRDDDALLRRRALFVLSQIQPVDRQTAKLLVYLLRDPDEEVRAEAEKALPALGKDIVPEVRKGLKAKEPEAQLASAKVLLALGVRDADVERVFRDGFGGATCVQKLELVKPLVAVSEDYRSKAQPFLVECLNEELPTYLPLLDALLNLTPLQEPALTKLTELFKQRKLPRAAQLQLLERAQRLGIPSTDIFDVLHEMLKEKDNAVRQLLIALLPDLGDAAKQAVPDLKAIAEDKNEEAILRDRAAFVLTRMAPDALDSQKYFVKELNGDTVQWAAATVEKLPPDKALPLLKRALSEVSSDHKATVLATIAKFGVSATDLKPEVVKFIKDGDRLVRHQAVLALLKIDPQSPEVLPALRREIIGPFGAEMTAEDLGPGATPLLQQIAAAPESNVEKQAAERLLKR